MIVVLVLEAIFAVTAAGCFLYVLLAIAEGERRKARALFLLTALGIGPLLTFLAGIRRANRLGIENAMCLWTVCVLALTFAHLGQLWLMTAKHVREASNQAAVRNRLGSVTVGTHESKPKEVSPPPMAGWAHVLPYAKQQGDPLPYLSSPFPGVKVSPLTPALRSHLGLAGRTGLLVTQIDPGAAAAKEGIKQYDVILTVNGSVFEEGEENVTRVSSATTTAKFADVTLRRGTERIEIKGIPVLE